MVDFVLNGSDLFVRQFGKFVIAWDVLSDKHICVFDETFLPRGVRVGEIDFCAEVPGDVFVFGEFGSVVSGQR